MAVQQVSAFEVNPGGRDALLSALGSVKQAADGVGVTAWISGQTAGPGVGNISASFVFADWEGLAAFNETNAGITQPVLDVLRSANPPARVVANAIRTEMLPRDSGVGEQRGFNSALIFDPGTGNASQEAEALGATRDVFESLGTQSRIWTPANGANIGRAVIVSGFDNLAGWARFRQRLIEHTSAGNPLPVAPLAAAGTIKSGGIIQMVAIEV